jgi:hypothetical protein
MNTNTIIALYLTPARAAWERATDLRDQRRAMERYRPADVGSRAYAVLLAAERQAVATAWSLEGQS